MPDVLTINSNLPPVPPSSPLVISTTALPNGVVGTAYSTSLIATGGIPPYTWGLPSAAPNTGGWLGINPATGVLSGTPGTAEQEFLIVSAKDKNGVVVTANLNFTVAASSATVRWNPGHYMLSDRTIEPGQTFAATLAPQVAVCAATDSRCKGYTLEIYWPSIETAQGVYDFTFIDAVLAVLAPAGKMLQIVTQYTVFGGSNSYAAPNYILSNVGTYGSSDVGGLSGFWSYGPGSSSGSAAVWRPNVSARYIALMQALAAKYNGNANVEMIGTNDESATSANVFYLNSSTDFTEAAYVTHWTNLYAQVVPNLPNCNFGGCLVNFTDGDSGVTNAPASIALIQVAYANLPRKVGMGWPDTSTTLESGFSWGQSAWRGEAGTPGFVYANNKMPCFAQMEGYIPNGTDFIDAVATMMPIAVKTVASGGLYTTHFSVSYQSGSAGQHGDWATDTYPAMLANPVQNTAYPY